MAELKKHALLIAFIAILIVIKFVLIPVIEWQDNQLQEIRLLEKKQQKIDKVLLNTSKVENLNLQLNKVLLKVNTALFSYQKESIFKLNQQKMLEAMLKKHDLKLDRIGWKTSAEVSESAMIAYRLEMRLKGKTANVIQFITDLESHDKLIEINKFTVSFKGQNNKKLGTIIGNLTLQLYSYNKV